MKRENQTLIALRLDPDLLDAIDIMRAKKRQSRSEFIRAAIFEEVKGVDGVTKDLIYPQDRVGVSKGGRPKKFSSEEPSGESPKS